MAEEFLDRIRSIATLDEAAAFAFDSDVELSEEAVNLFAKANSTKQERLRCAGAFKELKQRIHPLRTNAAAQALLKSCAAASADEKAKLQAKYVVLGQKIQNSDEGRKYDRVAGVLDRALAPLLALDHGTGRSNRAKRAKIASNVFTKNAGLSRPSGGVGGGDEDDRVDQHGNMLGSDWDLGRDGAYDGLKVVVLQEYSGEGFTGELPVAALREKGFDVVHIMVRNRDEARALSGALDDHLETASQVWLISSSYDILHDRHLNSIVENWQKGLGVYIFGDNVPYYADANRLLKRLSRRIGTEEGGTSAGKKAGSILKLAGNAFGDSIVGARTTERGPGFAPGHLLVTGISWLYEGVTVSALDGDIAQEMGFEEVLREHLGDLVVVARPSMGGCGPVLVDGAFTKLFCHWGRGGSARFVRNCACWLSTLVSDDEHAEPPAKAEPGAGAPPELNFEGAFLSECTISLEEGPAALLAAGLADAEQNTTDFALDNNLALGRRNLVLGSQPLSVGTAKLFLEQGLNPFTRQPVAAVLPLVSLADEDNRKLVAEVARQLFMGGRAMDRHAFNILLSVLEEMLHREPDNPEALQFMIRQILANAVSTPDMLKGIPGGPTVPLEQGLKNNLSITGEFVPLRKAFSHVSRIARLLAEHASDSARLPTDTLRQVVRRSLIKSILGAAARFAKNEKPESGSGHENALTEELDRLLFDQKLGISVAGTAKLVSLSQLGGIFEKVVSHTDMAEITDDAERTTRALGGGVLLSDAELTAALLLLRQRASELWKILIEPLLVELKDQHGIFRSIWDAPSVAEGDAPSPEEVLRRANAQLTASFVTEPAEHARIPWPGFATPLGPSVYRCKCGCVFGDPKEELSEETIEALRKARNAHFGEVFGADTNGYPTEKSAHFPLHRAVQRVLTRPAFKFAKSRTDEMEQDVAKYLLKAKRGNIHVPSIQGDIQFAIDTYLECRTKNMPEPGPGEAIKFADKAALERKLLLQLRAASAAVVGEQWLDRARQT